MSALDAGAGKNTGNDAPQDVEQDAGDGARRTAAVRPFAPVVALVLAAALAGTAAFGAHRAAGLTTARADALAAATSRVPDLLSYHAASLEEDLDRALAQTTGDFTADYQRILEDAVEPTAKKRKISTAAVVSAAGVVSADRDRVVVLVFLTQTTTAGKSVPAVTGSRVEVTMAKADGEWLIAGLDPV